jgi:hypothetical protein
MANERGWVARVNLPGGNAPGDDATGGGDGSGFQDYAGCNQGASAYPRSHADLDRLYDEAEGRIGPIVVAGTDVAALRKASATSNGDRREIVNPAVLAKPHIIAYGQNPGLLDADSRLNDYAASHGRSEGAE